MRKHSHRTIAGLVVVSILAAAVGCGSNPPTKTVQEGKKEAEKLQDQNKKMFPNMGKKVTPK